MSCYRFCSLGSGCDIFSFEDDNGNVKCRYSPHLSIKDKNVLDFLQPARKIYDGKVDCLDWRFSIIILCIQNYKIFFLSCVEGLGANLAKGSDMATGTLEEDWTGGG